MRNLLGRLNARSADSLQGIARFWSVPLAGHDRGRHVGVLYRTMTDVRAARQIWERLTPVQQAIVRELAITEADALPVAEIAGMTGLPEDEAREALVGLFRAGILARDGDNQELPVGAVPKLFLPRELGLLFRRLQDEIDAGDLSRSSLRVLLAIADDAEIEETAAKWGIRVIPGLRRRSELIDEILRQVAQPERIDRVTAALRPDAASLWKAVRQEETGSLPYEEAIARVWPRERPRAEARVREALDELETSLLVMHAYRRDGERRLFVPQEILHPGRIPTTLPLRPLQPLAKGTVHEPVARHPHALAWDLMTVLREISSFGAPVWVPGEPLSRTWQRRLNGRLWFGGDEVPPTGYLGFLLVLALGVGVVEPSAEPVGTMVDRNAIRPALSARIRGWRARSFAEQTAQLMAIWLASDQWTEGREREEIDVWGADWRGFRHRLLEALAAVPAGEWVLAEDMGRRLAEQNPSLLGTTFTAASARSSDDRGDARVSAIARIIAVELETALAWFGLVDLAPVAGKGLAVRVTDAARRSVAGDEAEPAADDSEREGPVLTLSETGTVTLNRPAPLHVWSLTAFGDAEALRPEAVYQLRPGSIGRALGAGFDLDQITEYLTRQSGAPLPEELTTLLRQWTVGYRRVRLRRATVLHPDSPAAEDDLRRIAVEAGLAVLDTPAPDGGLVVLLPESGEEGAPAEDHLLKALRAGGYVGQWLAPGSAPVPRVEPEPSTVADAAPKRPAPRRASRR
ncbi:MAG: helicase-associated domain-containing protein [Thermomicrobiales bacterium]